MSSAVNVTQRRIRAFPGSARVTRAGERVLAIANFLKALTALEEPTFKRSWFRRDAETNMPEACATQSHLPPTTPASTIAAMLDIRLIREKPDFVRERLAARGGGDEAKIDEVLRIDAERRKSETDLQRLQSERNRLSKEIGARRSRKEPSEELEAEVRKIGEQIAGLTQRANALDEEQRNLLLDIPNLPHASVPIGKDPSANRVVRSWGEKPQLTNAADHVALGTRLNLFNLEWAAKLSGSGFICFTGAGARLERALINFMLDLHTREHGYFASQSAVSSSARLHDRHDAACRSLRPTCTAWRRISFSSRQRRKCN